MLQAAMDKSVKVGPVMVPAKLKRADDKRDSSLKKPQIKKIKQKGGKVAPSVAGKSEHHMTPDKGS